MAGFSLIPTNMKLNIRFKLLLVLPVIISSCAPVYRCGESKPVKTPITWSRNLKTTVRERDWLCYEVASKEKEIVALKAKNTELVNEIKDLDGKVKELSADNEGLQSKYSDLIDKNLSQTDQLNKALKAKTEELNEKERLLIEREKVLNELKSTIARQDSITNRLNTILHSALLGFNPDELSVEIINGKVYVSLSDRLLFKSGSASVEEKGKDALKLLADVLNKNTDIDILVEGHTDNIPIKTNLYQDNWDLSVARATSIVRMLTVSYKIAPTRLTASGKGEYFPKAGNDTPEGRARNRRTEIILSPKLDEIMQLLNN